MTLAILRMVAPNERCSVRSAQRELLEVDLSSRHTEILQLSDERTPHRQRTADERRRVRPELGLEDLGTDTSAFICGPLSMRRAFITQLKDLGMPRREIYFEEFTLR